MSSLYQTDLLGKRDELFGQAVEIVIQEDGISIPILQRKMKIGYERAKRMASAMEALGIAKCENRIYKSCLTMEDWKIQKEKILSE